MPKQKITLNFFKLTTVAQNKPDILKGDKAISKSFAEISSNSKAIPKSNGFIVQYEEIISDSGYYLGTLLHSQTSGIPAKYNTKTRKLTTLDLQEDDALGQPVNFLFDPKLNIVMVESRKNGATIADLCSFMSANVDLPNIEPSIIIDPTKIDEYKKWDKIISFKAKLARYSEGTLFNAGRPKLITQMTSVAENTNTDTVEIGFKVFNSKDGGLNRSTITTLINQFGKYTKSEEVIDLIVRGKEDDGAIQTIDLIKHRLKDELFTEKVRMFGDFARSDRFAEMINIYNRHKNLLTKHYKLMT